MKLSKIAISILIIFGTAHSLLGQQVSKNYYLFPIKPGQRNYLAGTMGELRSTHFHAGLDVKTDGVSGLPIYASADGYVTRIKISPGGYGNALYMRHTNGTYTVYAHLSRYEDKIARYILKEQYKKESFSIELFPSQGQFQFKKGNIIAYSGNSGSSSGPHLHFEIRDKNQDVLNPLQYGFEEIVDNTAPTVQKIALVPLDINSRVNQVFQRTIFTPIRNGNEYTINRNISASGLIGVEILTYDRQNGVTNKNGVQIINLKIDGLDWFNQEINKISFATTRDVLALTNYQVMKVAGSRYNKLYISDGNRLKFYSQIKNNGKIRVIDGKEHQLEITLRDSYGNQSKLRFKITGEKLPVGIQATQKLLLKEENPYIDQNTLVIKAEVKDKQAPYAFVYANRMQHKVTPSYFLNKDAVYLWNLMYALPDSINICGEKQYFNFQAMVPSKSIFNFYNKHLNINFPKNSLYDSLFLTTNYTVNSDSTLESFEIGPIHTPLKKRLSVTLKPKLRYPDKKKYKAYRVADKDNFSYEGGQWLKDNFTFKTRDLGKYVLLSDPIPPTISPVSLNTKQIRFKIEDELSGVKSFKLLVNGSWVLMNYDYKRNLIWSEKLDPAADFKGEVKLIVEDNCGNRNVFNSKI